MSKSYSVRDDSRGKNKWSHGGTHCQWSRNRKIWGDLRSFKSHLAMFYPFDYNGLKYIKTAELCPGTLIPVNTFPYSNKECVIIEIDDDPVTVKEFPAAAWAWNHSYFPRYLREPEYRQEKIKKEIGTKGALALALCEPINVDAVRDSNIIETLSEQEISDLIDAQPDDFSPEDLVRATEARILEKLAAARGP